MSMHVFLFYHLSGKKGSPFDTLSTMCFLTCAGSIQSNSPTERESISSLFAIAIVLIVIV